MTHCRTGCGAEINYREVNFSGFEFSYHIPMEGVLIHDCPKLKPSTNDDTNDYLNKLQFLHNQLHGDIVGNIVYEYGSQILDFINLPQELKMYSKPKLAERLGVKSGPGLSPDGSDLTKEDFDELPNYQKEMLQNEMGFAPPNQTIEERLTVFWRVINESMSFLQRCADLYPAPFYTYNGYSQLELFRIFLESKEQYGDAIICHTIQGAIDTAKAQMNVDVFTEVTDRLQKKLEEQKLAQAEEGEKNWEEHKEWWISKGMTEAELEQVDDGDEQLEELREAGETEYHDSIMKWALDLYKKEYDKTIEESRQDDSLEHHEEQIEVDDTVHKEQSVDGEIFEQVDAEETRTAIFDFEKDFLRPAVRKQFSSEKEMNEKLKNMKWGVGGGIVGNLFEKAQSRRKKEEGDYLQAEDYWKVGLLRFLDFSDDVKIGEWPSRVYHSLKEIELHRHRLMAHPNDYRKEELKIAQKIVGFQILRCKQYFESSERK